jgi:Zn-dependent peptidase ImmA (M78 family)
MGIQPALINKDTLKLICETRNVTDEYISRMTKQEAAKIEQWKDPRDPLLPTINQAKDLARCLGVPFAGLYMNPEFVPTAKLPRFLDKRTVPGGGIPLDDSAMNLAVFDLLRLRTIVLNTKRELRDSVAPFAYPGTLDGARELALQLRVYLGVSYALQKATASPRQFFLLVRSKIEDKGILVGGFDGVRVEAVRGMALYFDELPIIGINNLDRPPAKTFSMLHEMVHILKRHSTACNEIGPLSASDSEEVFCNAVAGEFLVPAGLLQQEAEVRTKGIDAQAIKALAARYSVSREVVSRRLLDLGYLQKSEYEEIVEALRIQLAAEQNRPKGSGPSQYRRNMAREAFDKNGMSLCKALQQGLDRELYSRQDVGDFLGIRLKHVPRLLAEASRW